MTTTPHHPVILHPLGSRYTPFRRRTAAIRLRGHSVQFDKPDGERREHDAGSMSPDETLFHSAMSFSLTNDPVCPSSVYDFSPSVYAYYL
ncbi:hypothetical protein FB45DRAFT_1053359, partial [Roridomyces roridus]